MGFRRTIVSDAKTQKFEFYSLRKDFPNGSPEHETEGHWKLN